MLDICNLKQCEINKYSKQIILPDLGINGQVLLKNCRILIVGCGGLGCSSGVYLAGSGVGLIGLVDHGLLEENSIYPLICHTGSNIKKNKSDSLAEALKMLNSMVNITSHPVKLTCHNAMDVIKNYDVVLDCTNSEASRYVLNDCCVILKKPLVSADALAFEGHLTIYNLKNSPCYRCLFPIPSETNSLKSSSDVGVLGGVTGVLGILQANETMKIITQIGKTYSGKMLSYDAKSGDFKTVPLIQKRADCVICSDNSNLTEPIDNMKFFNADPINGFSGNMSILDPSDRISVAEYNLILQASQPHVLIDVRPKIQIDACKFSNAIEIQMSQLNCQKSLDKVFSAIRKAKAGRISDERLDVFVICRRGNNSQIAVEKLKSLLENEQVSIKDIVGGMRGWAETFDSDLPVF